MVVDERNWEKDFNTWIEGDGPKPGPHPVPSHPWNVDQNKYIEHRSSIAMMVDVKD